MVAACRVMSFEEIERLARIFVERYGVDSIRLTGGEPTVRAHLPVLVAKLAALRTADGPVDLAMTTNGATMRLVAGSLREAGLRRVNISLDTLDRAKFAEMTRRDELDNVLDGIAAAQEAGFDPVKINAVIERGVNDDEIVDLATFGRDARRRGPLHRVHAARRRRALGERSGRRPGRDRRRRSTPCIRSSRCRRVVRRRPIGSATSTVVARSA